VKISGRTLLLAAGSCSFAVAALHVAIAISGQASWYRYFGGLRQAVQVEAGSVLRPTLLTLAIAAVFALWGCYGLSGAGVVRRLPFLRAALFAIAGIYLLRALVLIPELPALWRGLVPLRYPAFSVISGCAGVLYLLGVLRAPHEGGGPRAHAA